MYQDQTVTCADCATQFVFTAGEQAFYAEKGFTEPPKRCPACRAARKSQRQTTGAGAGGGYGGRSYDSGGYSSSSGGYSGSSGGGYSDSGYSNRGSYGGGGGGYGGGERRPREMYDVTCANCGRAAQVPFQPTGSRPVYCSDCFQSQR